MNWLHKRLNEGSTWGGLGMAIVGLGNAMKIDEAPQAAGAVEAAGQAFAAGMPWWQALLLGITGVAMTVKSDGDKGF